MSKRLLNAALEGFLHSAYERNNGIRDSRALRELAEEVGWELLLQLVLQNSTSDGNTPDLCTSMFSVTPAHLWIDNLKETYL